MKNNWILKGVNKSVESTPDFFKGSPHFLEILKVRGLENRTDIGRFLYPEINEFHSPFLLKGMESAVNRIHLAASSSENVAIFADSDIDGITSLTIIHDILIKLGIVPGIRYPRDKEGYGLNREIIDEFHANGIGLVITVDSGIRDIEEILYAKQKGIDFIVTDHHEPDTELPDAIIINPKQSDCYYPFRDLAGAGVALKLAKALLFGFSDTFDKSYHILYHEDDLFHVNIVNRGHITESGSIRNIERYISELHSESDNIVICNDDSSLSEIKSMAGMLPVYTFADLVSHIVKKNDMELDIYRLASDIGMRDQSGLSPVTVYSKVFLELQLRSKNKLITKMDYYTSLATLGTIADIMPLRGENRQIVKKGLEVINSGDGHHGITAILKNKKATTKSIGWDVAPLLNAPGRLGKTESTVDFFLESDILRIEENIKELNRLNRLRRNIVSETIDRIERKSNYFSCRLDNVFYYYDDEIPEGISGLVANRVAEKIHKPVIILSNSGCENYFKGSGRSPEGIDFFYYVEKFSEHFERIGGHAQAFGFTIDPANVENVVSLINSALENTVISKEYHIDCMLDLSEITMGLLNEIELLEPYGKENPEPVFCTENILPQTFRFFGAAGDHGKFILKNGIEAIGWSMGKDMEERFNLGTGVDLVYRLEKNFYMNSLSIRMNIIDID